MEKTPTQTKPPAPYLCVALPRTAEPVLDEVTATVNARRVPGAPRVSRGEVVALALAGLRARLAPGAV